MWGTLLSLLGRVGGAFLAARAAPGPNFAGLLARLSLQGGNIGALSRIGLAGYVQSIGRKLPEGTIGFLARDFADLSKSLIGLPEQIKSWSQELIESQHGLAPFSGRIAQAFGQLEADRIRRNIQTARDTENSTRYAIRGQSQFEAALRPWEAAVVNLKNVLVGAASRAAAAIINPDNLTSTLTPAIGGGIVKRILEESVKDAVRGAIKRDAQGNPVPRKPGEPDDKPPQKNPDDWWKGPIPQSPTGGPLDQMIIDIAHGKYHSRQSEPMGSLHSKYESKNRASL